MQPLYTEKITTPPLPRQSIPATSSAPASQIVNQSSSWKVPTKPLAAALPHKPREVEPVVGGNSALDDSFFENIDVDAIAAAKLEEEGDAHSKQSAPTGPAHRAPLPPPTAVHRDIPRNSMPAPPPLAPRTLQAHSSSANADYGKAGRTPPSASAWSGEENMGSRSGIHGNNFNYSNGNGDDGDGDLAVAEIHEARRRLWALEESYKQKRGREPPATPRHSSSATPRQNSSYSSTPHYSSNVPMSALPPAYAMTPPAYAMTPQSGGYMSYSQPPAQPYQRQAPSSYDGSTREFSNAGGNNGGGGAYSSSSMYDGSGDNYDGGFADDSDRGVYNHHNAPAGGYGSNGNSSSSSSGYDGTGDFSLGGGYSGGGYDGGGGSRSYQPANSMAPSYGNDSGDGKECFCGEPCVLLTSRSENNPNREFYKCRNSGTTGEACDFFEWADGGTSNSSSMEGGGSSMYGGGGDGGSVGFGGGVGGCSSGSDMYGTTASRDFGGMSEAALQATFPPETLSPWKENKDVFGHNGFRHGQQEVVIRAMQGQDVFCLMPTGGGKSLCYQLPAYCCPGLAVVFSPLISLIQDQCEGMAAMGVEAVFLNSAQDYETQVGVISVALTLASFLIEIQLLDNRTQRKTCH